MARLPEDESQIDWNDVAGEDMLHADVLFILLIIVGAIFGAFVLM